MFRRAKTSDDWKQFKDDAAKFGWLSAGVSIGSFPLVGWEPILGLITLVFVIGTVVQYGLYRYGKRQMEKVSE